MGKLVLQSSLDIFVVFRKIQIQLTSGTSEVRVTDLTETFFTGFFGSNLMYLPILAFNRTLVVNN